MGQGRVFGGQKGPEIEGWMLPINALEMESYAIAKKSLLSKFFRKERPIHHMNKLFQATLLTTAFVVSSHAQTITTTTFGSGANSFSIDFVEIGNPGTTLSDGSTVAYTYNMGKFEITRDQIEKANAAGSLGITLQNMTSYGGNGLNRPATGISWNEAARFVNYLNTSQGYQAAYRFTTSGANANVSFWGQTNDPVAGAIVNEYSGENRLRHKDAKYVLPNRDEWWKAAYGSPDGNDYLYPTGSNSAPTKVTGGTLLGTAVYGYAASQGPADANNAGGLSAFGTMGQGGNAWEWIDNGDFMLDPLSSRQFTGGAWNFSIAGFERPGVNPQSAAPTTESFFQGFRVAMVPEPSALSLLAVGLGLVLRRSRRTI